MEDDLNSEELMQQLELLITEEAPSELQHYQTESTDHNNTNNNNNANTSTHKGRLGLPSEVADGRKDGGDEFSRNGRQ
jgi:hypothetical protein